MCRNCWAKIPADIQKAYLDAKANLNRIPDVESPAYRTAAEVLFYAKLQAIKSVSNPFPGPEFYANGQR